MPLAHMNLGAEESMRGIRGWLRRAHYAGEYILMHRGATMTWIYEDREEKRGSVKNAPTSADAKAIRKRMCFHAFGAASLLHVRPRLK